MVLMNLFAGKEWRFRCRQWTCGHSVGRREWEEWRKYCSMDVCTVPRYLGRSYCVTQGAQPDPGDDLEGWDEGREAQESGYMCIIVADLPQCGKEFSPN